MAYAIMRIEKRRREAVNGIMREGNRTLADHEKGCEFKDSEIDWSRTANNIHLVKSEHWLANINKQIAEAGLKARKDSTVMIDGVYTASPVWFETHTHAEMMDYFKACLEFHAAEYCGGDSSRIINAVVHLDETTPHLHIASVPIVRDERGAHLSAKMILGNRRAMSMHQDHFHEAVARDRGLDRGERRPTDEEQRVHLTKREWQLMEAERKIVEAERQLKAHQTAIQELIEARRREGKPKPIHEGKSYTGRFGGAMEGVTYSYEDAERLQGHSELVPLLKGYVNSVSEMQRLRATMEQWPDSIEAVRKADEARAHWVERARRYEQAAAQYAQLLQAFPAEVEQMEQQLEARTRSHKQDRAER